MSLYYRIKEKSQNIELILGGGGGGGGVRIVNFSSQNSGKITELRVYITDFRGKSLNFEIKVAITFLFLYDFFIYEQASIEMCIAFMWCVKCVKMWDKMCKNFSSCNVMHIVQASHIFC